MGCVHGLFTRDSRAVHLGATGCCTSWDAHLCNVTQRCVLATGANFGHSPRNTSVNVCLHNGEQEREWVATRGSNVFAGTIFRLLLHIRVWTLREYYNKRQEGSLYILELDKIRIVIYLKYLNFKQIYWKFIISSSSLIMFYFVARFIRALTRNRKGIITYIISHN